MPIFKYNVFLGAILLLCTISHPPELFADKNRNYKLESIELLGTERITLEQLTKELAFKTGDLVNDAIVTQAQEQLLSLGLFKSVLLYLRRGSQSGLVKLVIEVEDETSVLTPWALGSEISIMHSEVRARSADPGSPPLSYKIKLVGRNLFRSMHRGNLALDFDATGLIRNAHLAYGLPRFTRENMQFDAEVLITDVKHRYLDGNGFAGRAQGLWSTILGPYSTLQYGPAMYVNRKDNFAMPGFPSSVAGPKISYYHETRLLSFIPESGYQFSSSILLSTLEAEHTVIELSGAQTFNYNYITALTLQCYVMTISTKGYSMRAETRFDQAFGKRTSKGEQGEIYLRLRAGADEIDDNHLTGSAAIIGLRYFSPGLIADLGLQITKSPKQLVNNIVEREMYE